MDLEKDNSSQGAPGVLMTLPMGLDEVLQKKFFCVTLQEFKKQGIKEVKVINQKSLEEFINLVVEERVAASLDREKVIRAVLEEEVYRLKKEIEALRKSENARPVLPNVDLGGRLKETIRGAIERAKEGLGIKDIPVAFIESLEQALLRGLDAGYRPLHNIPEQPKELKETKPVGKRGGFYDTIFRENLQLRGSGKNTPVEDSIFFNKKENQIRPLRKCAGLFESIFKENLQLRRESIREVSK